MCECVCVCVCIDTFCMNGPDIAKPSSNMLGRTPPEVCESTCAYVCTGLLCAKACVCRMCVSMASALRRSPSGSSLLDGAPCHGVPSAGGGPLARLASATKQTVVPVLNVPPPRVHSLRESATRVAVARTRLAVCLCRYARLRGKSVYTVGESERSRKTALELLS